ncbi:hypothetical protein M0N77_00500 [Psychrobacter sp. AH5]|uniref:hypothetical protein n=1 Tax=Psychrobacter sp. AH5 TaxID=2937433 RepID=UPI00333E36B7
MTINLARLCPVRLYGLAASLTCLKHLRWYSAVVLVYFQDGARLCPVPVKPLADDVDSYYS